MDVLLVANADAGFAAGESVEEARRALSAVGPVEVLWTRHPGELEPHLRRRPSLVVVAGGDGTVHAVVQRLWDLGVLGDLELGLVPLGTGNDLARGLGIPLDPGAAACLADGEERALDLLVGGDGTVVVNAVHAGLGAEAAEAADGLKPALGPLAYPLGAALASAREEGWELEVALDGEPLPAPGPKLLLVAVANGPTVGGGTPLCPPARLDDGLLDVLVVAAVPMAARLALAAALRKGEHLDREEVLHRRGHRVALEGEPVRHDVDGEVTEPLASREYRVVPAAWRVRLPPSP